MYDEYGDRMGYLKSLSDEYGADLSEVIVMADLLGANEDFDALVTCLQDIAEKGGQI